MKKDRGIGIAATIPATRDRNQLTKAQLQAELEKTEQELRTLESIVKQLIERIDWKRMLHEEDMSMPQQQLA